MVLTNTVIAGAPKCGTTSLFFWLDAHPDVCGTDKKDAQYLMDRDSSVFRPHLNYHDHGLEGYNRHYGKESGQSYPIYLDATPGYIYQNTALEVLGNELTGATLLFILRAPADRLYSIYSYFSQNKAELDNRLTFSTFIEMINEKDPALQANEFLKDAIRHGQYIDYLTTWRDRCGPDRVHVFLYEDLKRDPKGFTQQVAEVLGIDPSFYGDFPFKAHNVTYQVKNQALHKLVSKVRSRIPKSGVRNVMRTVYRRYNVKKRPPKQVRSDATNASLAQLKAYYEPYNEALSRAFGIDVAQWK